MVEGEMSNQPQRFLRNTLCNFCDLGFTNPIENPEEILLLRHDFMAKRSRALVESTKEEERVLCNIPTNDFTLLQTKRMFDLLSRLDKVEKFPNQAFEELYIRRDELRRALARSALTIFHELDLASLIHRAELSLEVVLNETDLFRSQVEGIKIERPFVEAEFSLKTQIQGLLEIYEERRDDLNAHEFLAIARLEFQYKEWRTEMRDACEWIGHDNKQCRLDATAALVIPVPLESLAIHDRECTICNESLGPTLEDREAELPV